MFFCVIPELNSQFICLGPWYLEVICSMRSEYRQGLSCYFLLLCRVSATGDHITRNELPGIKQIVQTKTTIAVYERYLDIH